MVYTFELMTVLAVIGWGIAFYFFINQPPKEKTSPQGTEVEQANVNEIEFSQRVDDHVGAIPQGYSLKVDYSKFPEIKLDKKPQPDDFVKEKEKYALMCFEAIAPYRNAIVNFGPYKGRKDVRVFFDDILKEFIVRFWDMPASEAHHHSRPFGLVAHSVETAYHEMERNRSTLAYTASGAIDTQGTRDNVFWGPLIGFLVGLFHDAGKIFDMDIRAQESKGSDYVYSPFMGSLLNFHLVFAGFDVKKSWKPGRAMAHQKANLFMLLAMVPKDFWKMVPAEVLVILLDVMTKYDTLEGDVKSVVGDQRKDHSELKGIKKTLGEILQQEILLVNQKFGHIYKLPENFCFVREDFFEQLSENCEIEEERLVEILKDLGVLVHNTKGEYIKKFEVATVGEGESNFLTGALMESRFFDELRQSFVNDAYSVGHLRIDISSKPLVVDLFGGRDIFPEIFYIDAQKEKKKIEAERKKRNAKQKNDDPEVEKKFQNFMSQLGEKYFLQDWSNKKGKRVGVFTLQNELYLIINSLKEIHEVSQDLTEGEASEERTKFLKKLIRGGFCEQIDNNNYSKMTLEYVSSPDDTLDVPTKKAIESIFFKVNMNMIGPETSQYLEGFQKRNEAFLEMFNSMKVGEL